MCSTACFRNRPIACRGVSGSAPSPASYADKSDNKRRFSTFLNHSPVCCLMVSAAKLGLTMGDRLPSDVGASLGGGALAPSMLEADSPRLNWRSRKLPRIDRLKSYWEERRGNRLVPLRRDIDPVDL